MNLHYVKTYCFSYTWPFICRCHSQNYSEHLPNASIVICFYNEQLDTLVRSVHSILDRTPTHLLNEIILVDDFSDIGK